MNTDDRIVIVKLVNGLFQAYKMGSTYANWKDNSTLDRNFIVTDKCASLIPDYTLRHAFINAWNRLEATK